MISALEAIISGRVQGVMYRDFTRRKAESLGIVGEVENLIDGTVRLYAEGEEEGLEKFVAALKKGTFLSRVENIEYKFLEPKGTFSSFSIVYD